MRLILVVVSLVVVQCKVATNSDNMATNSIEMADQSNFDDSAHIEDEHMRMDVMKFNFLDSDRQSQLSHLPLDKPTLYKATTVSSVLTSFTTTATRPAKLQHYNEHLHYSTSSPSSVVWPTSTPTKYKPTTLDSGLFDYASHGNFDLIISLSNSSETTTTSTLETKPTPTTAESATNGGLAQLLDPMGLMEMISHMLSEMMSMLLGNTRSNKGGDKGDEGAIDPVNVDALMEQIVGIFTVPIVAFVLSILGADPVAIAISVWVVPIAAVLGNHSDP